MTTEARSVAEGRGKWSVPGLPHKGWNCVQIEDLGAPDRVCEMCETSAIRYVHYMEHPAFPETLAVGCVCAGHMEEDASAATTREKSMKSRAGKRKRWLTRQWKVSRKGNGHLSADGYHVTVYPRRAAWGAFVSSVGGSFKQNSRLDYRSKDAAKLAAFDLITRLLSGKEG